MEVHEIIEEVDEDKNNNNTNQLKNGKLNRQEKNNNIKDINIKSIKEIEEKEVKNIFKKSNKFNQMYKSLAFAKDKNKNNLDINENLNYNLTNKGNEFHNKTKTNFDIKGDKSNSKIDNISKINLPLLYISSKNKLLNNLNNETPSTSAYTNSTKNNLRNDHNLTEQISKFRIGLFSANSSSNNAIIPILPIKRPVSNFNFGGNQLWEKDDSIKDNKKLNNNHNEIILKKEIELNKEEKLKDINLNKFFEKTKSRDIFKSTDFKYKSVSFNNKFENLSNNINLKPKMNKLTKEKVQDNFFNMKLIEFKKMPNHLNKNNYFRSRNGNKSHSVKKFD